MDKGQNLLRSHQFRNLSKYHAAFLDTTWRGRYLGTYGTHYYALRAGTGRCGWNFSVIFPFSLFPLVPSSSSVSPSSCQTATAPPLLISFFPRTWYNVFGIAAPLCLIIDPLCVTVSRAPTWGGFGSLGVSGTLTTTPLYNVAPERLDPSAGKPVLHRHPFSRTTVQISNVNVFACFYYCLPSYQVCLYVHMGMGSSTDEPYNFWLARRLALGPPPSSASVSPWPTHPFFYEKEVKIK